MGNLFKNKYRTTTGRLGNYNYSQDGYYFITICTAKKKLFFGKIEKDKMILNKLGKIVDNFWQEIPKYFDSVQIDKYIIMPNHLHGIVIITNSRGAIHGVSEKSDTEKLDAINPSEKLDAINPSEKLDAINPSEKLDAINRVSTVGGATGKFNPMGKNNLGQIIRWFKGRSTFEINKKHPNFNFKWQANYYDHIIRDEQGYVNIWDYIDYNPDKWVWDKENSKGIKH